MLIQSDDKVNLLSYHIKVYFMEQIEKSLMTGVSNSGFPPILFWVCHLMSPGKRKTMDLRETLSKVVEQSQIPRAPNR